MIWLLTALYFLLWSPVIRFVFWPYGEVLIRIGQTGVIVKKLGSLVIGILFSCFIVSPLFSALYLINNHQIEAKSNLIYSIYLGACFLLSIVPGWLFFKKRYLSTLKALGIY